MLIQNFLFLRTKCNYSNRIFPQYNILNIEKSNLIKGSSEKIYILSSFNLGKNKKSNNYIESFANKKILSRNLLHKLINKYWEETIFLSTPSNISDIYAGNLKANGMSLDNNEYKKFLVDFNKDLNVGRIKAIINSDINQSKNTSNSLYIKYKWKKGLNLGFKSLRYLFNIRNIFNQGFIDKKLLQVLNNNEAPVFTVINSFNQIVMAEPSRKIINNLRLLDNLYILYDKLFNFPHNNRPTYEGLFFINPIDACEYKQYIESKYHQSDVENHLYILASKLSFYYRIVNKCIPMVTFRLIPDLHEVGKLIFKYRKFSNLSFHDQQNYGKNYFQGQPIYIIQPTFATNRITKKIIPLDYNHEINNLKRHQASEALFLSYDTVLLAWKKMKEKYKDYSLSSHPKIIVYNLEDYIDNTTANFVLIPSKESFDFIQRKDVYQKKHYISQILSSKLLSIRVLTKRIIWSLTSKQPNLW